MPNGGGFPAFIYRRRGGHFDIKAIEIRGLQEKHFLIFRLSGKEISGPEN